VVRESPNSSKEDDTRTGGQKRVGQLNDKGRTSIVEGQNVSLEENDMRKTRRRSRASSLTSGGHEL